MDMQLDVLMGLLGFLTAVITLGAAFHVIRCAVECRTEDIE